MAELPPELRPEDYATAGDTRFELIARGFRPDLGGIIEINGVRPAVGASEIRSILAKLRETTP